MRVCFVKLVQFFELKRGNEYPKGHSFAPPWMPSVLGLVPGAVIDRRAILTTDMWICWLFTSFEFFQFEMFTGVELMPETLEPVCMAGRKRKTKIKKRIDICSSLVS